MCQLLLRSWNVAVDYMMPMGLHHIFAFSHHYGPEPWCNLEGMRPDWLPPYYHQADSAGLGFDRTRSGSDAVSQYHEPLATIYNDVHTCPEEYLLWFHHVPWDFVMSDGLTMWENLCYTYYRGAEEAARFTDLWREMRPYVDAERYAAMLKRFERQSKDAVWWRDACAQYFARFSARPIPADCTKPVHLLQDLMEFRLDIDNYTAADMEKLP